MRSPVVKLAEAAAILGVSARAAESALRKAGIRSGYPRAEVEWLRGHRPGQGARTDLKGKTMMLRLDLPAGTHAAILTGRDVVTGEPLSYPVVWADRTYDMCPRCNQPVDRIVEDCPVILNAGAGVGGQLDTRNQQHGCGKWLSVDWFEPVDAAEEGILAAAQEMADGLRIETEVARQGVRERLRRDLAAVLAAMAEPLDGRETPEDRIGRVRTGSEVEPGVYLDGDEWVAWDYDPDGSGDPITVTAGDL